MQPITSRLAVHKKAVLLLSLLALILTASACDDNTANTQERDKVDEQQRVYAESQPIPKYDFSLARHLWIQFYDAQNKQVTTFSYISPLNGGPPEFDCPSMGYALPRDTQLTNPLQRTPEHDAVVAQAEPNGLFTSPNTDATIVFCLNSDGTVSPVYTELKVNAFPFPVKWQVDPDYPTGHWVRVGEDSNIKLNPNK